tara:strand:- start:358 stop:774 length:417 start_codon:yes stop_codon:yes gene_type:complete
MAKRATQLEKTAQGAVKAATRAGLRTAITTTPVATGNAKSNWNVSLRVPIITVIDNLKIGGSGAAGNFARGRGLPIINTFKLADGTMFITNGVHYIRGLDDGTISSKGGFMSAKAVVAANKALKAYLSKGVFVKGRKG